MSAHGGVKATDPFCDGCGSFHDADEHGRVFHIDGLCEACAYEEYSGPRIKTHYVFPPIPIRHFDWQAFRDGWEPGLPMGWGSTENAAIKALLHLETETEPDTEEKQ